MGSSSVQVKLAALDVGCFDKLCSGTADATLDNCPGGADARESCLAPLLVATKVLALALALAEHKSRDDDPTNLRL